MPQVIAIYGSPRRKGNTNLLLDQAVAGVQESGCSVISFHLQGMKISPCLEIYGCKKDGRCVIKDDFQLIYDAIIPAEGIMLASPIFFYSLSAQMKIFMDRCQAFWVKKHWIDKRPHGENARIRKGFFLAAAASHGNRLFEGASLSVRYFYEALDTELTEEHFFRGLDHAGDVIEHQEYLDKMHMAGKRFGKEILSGE